MLSYEWRELETLCQRIADMRDRYATARRSRNTGLMINLEEDIAAAQRQRELLVQHISARLGTVAAGHEIPESPVDRARRQRSAARETDGTTATRQRAPGTITGFEEN